MSHISFWAPLIISFIAFKFEDIFIALLFVIVALIGLASHQLGFKNYTKEVSRKISTRKGSITLNLDTRTAKIEDVDELTTAFTQTAALFRTLINHREDIEKSKK